MKKNWQTERLLVWFLAIYMKIEWRIHSRCFHHLTLKLGAFGARSTGCSGGMDSPPSETFPNNSSLTLQSDSLSMYHMWCHFSVSSDLQQKNKNNAFGAVWHLSQIKTVFLLFIAITMEHTGLCSGPADQSARDHDQINCGCLRRRLIIDLWPFPTVSLPPPALSDSKLKLWTDLHEMLRKFWLWTIELFDYWWSLMINESIQGRHVEQ